MPRPRSSAVKPRVVNGPDRQQNSCILPCFLSLVLVHLLGARGAVVVAEYAEQRAAEVLRHLDWRDARLALSSSLPITTRPPQRSAQASTSVLWQA